MIRFRNLALLPAKKDVGIDVFAVVCANLRLYFGILVSNLHR